MAEGEASVLGEALPPAQQAEGQASVVPPTADPAEEPPAKRPRPDLWIGRYGQAQLCRALCEAPDVGAALAEVQRQHGVPCDEACSLALPLLRLMGVERGEVAQRLQAFLQRRLLATVATLGRPKLLALLPLVLPYARQPFACEVLAAIASSRHLAAVPPAYLRALGADPAVFGQLPLPLRRRVWEADVLRWRQDVLRFLKTYTAAAAAQAPLALVSLATAGGTPWRCAAEAVVELAQAVGPSAPLLSEAVRMLRGLWLKHHHVEAGQLFHQLLLEVGAARGEALGLDPRLHRVAVAADRLISQPDGEGRAARDVGVAAAACRGDDASATPVGLLLSHPLVAAALAREALRRSAATATPETDDVVQCCTRLLGVGCAASGGRVAAGLALGRQALAARVVSFLTKFGADEEANVGGGPLLGTLSASPSAADAEPGGPEADPRLAALLAANGAAQALLLARCLQLAHEGRPGGLGAALDLVATLGDERLGMEDAWLEALSLLALGPPLRPGVAAALLRRLFRRCVHLEAAANGCCVLLRGLAEAMPPADFEILVNTSGVDFPALQEDDAATVASTPGSPG